MGIPHRGYNDEKYFSLPCGFILDLGVCVGVYVCMGGGGGGCVLRVNKQDHCANDEFSVELSKMCNENTGKAKKAPPETSWVSKFVSNYCFLYIHCAK